MKLKNACDIAVGCSLETIEEAIRNIEIHAPSLFGWSEINYELKELMADAQDYKGNEKIVDIFPELYKEEEF